MFGKMLKAIVVVHDDTVHWLTCGRCPAGQDPHQMPLEQVLTDTTVADRIPAGAKGNHQSLWIVPDHWFGMERYPFQSDKSALIVPFLERKLTAAHPECKQVRHFFNYKHTAAAGGGHELLAYFLQDEKAYLLYDALAKIGQVPRYITTPAFLWMDRLTRVAPEFGQEGTLLIHMGTDECLLYFYFKGNYFFSRNVMLSEGPDRMEALTFEINQSLYMFSQKTKSELNRIYLMTPTPQGPEAFGQALGREVIDLAPLLVERACIEIDTLPLLKGLLSQADMFSLPRFFSVTQRQVRYELAWEPVQRAGIAIGIALLLPLLGLNLLLGHMRRGDADETENLRRMSRNAAVSLQDYDSALDGVLQAGERPECADVALRILSSMPAGMRVRELVLNTETSPPAWTLKAALPAHDDEQLKAALSQLVAGLKSRFNTPPDFSLNNIEIGMDPQENGRATPHYWIVLRLELT